MQFVNSILQGYSQVLFLSNNFVGCIIIILLALFSPAGFLLSAVSSITAYATAVLLGVEKNILESGLYGYNGVLLGIVISLFVKQTYLGILLAVLGGAFTSILIFYLVKQHVAPLAAPYVFVAWTILILIRVLRVG